MNNIKLIIKLGVIGFFSWTCATYGQSSCDGFWVANYKDLAKGWDTTAELTITGTEAKWKATLGMHDRQGSPCRDHTFPAIVLLCSDDALEFRVDGSELASPRADHCPNWHVLLRRLDADHAEGLFVKQQIPLTIVRRHD